ncbi:hypothetical protein D1B31_15460 [Neobacillus notoginsengisoli]|uniref:Uncharacterized protein n=1 Tax=Neobacillus notoginsengisoli TaxID=1578198 RepID=A0A417YS96_9BACI|nr:hypothetical protein [Neobacillus notoginsengisoli]RHW38166.1 hypothetical protein D1B31_15460 [Neobacillus notoginsengisoli]
MAADIKEKLLKDIKKTGYPFELTLHNKLIKNDWKVIANAYYIDKDEKKGREIDFIASNHISEYINGELLEIAFYLIIEVKKATDKPWVIFTVKNRDRFSKLLPLKLNYTETVFEIQGQGIYSAFHKNGTKVHDSWGKSFYEGFSGNGGRDDIYKALSGSVKALIHFKETNSYSDFFTERLISYYEPIVVIEGQLFESWLDNNEEIQIKESNYIQTSFNYISPNYYEKESINDHIVHIVRANYLEEFLKQKEKSLKNVFHWISKKEFSEK